MDITKLSDLELAKLQGQTYEKLFIEQANLRMIQCEIEKRTPKVEVKSDTATA